MAYSMVMRVLRIGRELGGGVDGIAKMELADGLSKH